MLVAAMPALPPFTLEPWFSPRPWGAKSLRPWFPLDSPGEPIGEAWLTGNDSRIATGEHRGTTLGELLRIAPETVLGDGAQPGDDYPLLIKLIFPKDKLSVQVHPDDATAQRLGHPRGKTECWYVLDAEPGAAVQLGLRSGATVDSVRDAVAGGSFDALVESVPVERGDMVYVDAGTVHAIGPGVVLLETQQQSDVTFRLYDYGRPRPLHIAESLASLKTATQAGKVAPRQLSQNVTELIANDFFRITEYRLAPNEHMQFPALPSPRTLFLRTGDASLGGLPIAPNHVAVIPAQYDGAEMISKEGAHLLEMVPGPRA